MTFKLKIVLMSTVLMIGLPTLVRAQTSAPIIDMHGYG